MKKFSMSLSFRRNPFQHRHRAPCLKRSFQDGKKIYSQDQRPNSKSSTIKSGLMFAFALAFLLPLPTQAQYQLPKNVFGNGGGSTSSSNHYVVGTFGQPIIGVIQSPSNNKYVGFWYLGGIASSNSAPVVDSVLASFLGQPILPIGNALVKVLRQVPMPITLHVNASDPDPGDAITKLRFDLDGQIYEDTDPSDSFTWPNLGLGALPPTSSADPNRLTLSAFDSRNLASNPFERYLDVIAQPCWIANHPQAFVFRDNLYQFDLRFPQPIYGLDYTIPNGIFLIGGRRIALGLDFDMSWVHGILTHLDFINTLSGHFNVVVLDAELVKTDRPGNLEIGDRFDIEQAKVKFTLDTGYRRVYYKGIKLDLVKVAKVNLSVELLARLEIDLNMAFDNCLELGPGATLVPVISAKGVATASVEVLFGVASASVSASPGLSIWLITPLTDTGNWGAGGEVWLDWSASGKIFWVIKFKKTGRFGPYQFGKPRPTQKEMLASVLTQLEPNLPDVLPRPAVASDSAGNILLVWVKDNEPIKDLAFPQIHAANWNALTGFTALAPLTTGERFDYDPAVARDKNGNAVAIWTRNKLSIADTARSFEDILANTEIAAASYNVQSKTWSTAQLITNDNFADGLADVALLNNGDALAVWTHTKDNDLETRSDWEIKYAARKNNSWSAPLLLTNDNAADHSVKVASDGAGRALAVWTRDADADAITVNDIEIAYALWNGNAWLPAGLLTNTLTEEHHPEVAFDAAGAPYAAWVQRTILSDSSKVECLMFAQGDLQQPSWSVPEMVFADSLLLEEPSLKIATRAGEEIALLSWRSYDELDGDVFLSMKNLATDSPWSLPQPVSQDTLVDWMSTATFDSRNNAMILSVKTDIHNPATDNSTLGNFADGINYFAAGLRSNLQLTNALNTVGGYLGDVTGEGKVTALDALVLETYRLGLLTNADYQQRIALGFGDVNFDGATDALDVRFILQYAVEETAPAAIGKWIWF